MQVCTRSLATAALLASLWSGSAAAQEGGIDGSFDFSQSAIHESGDLGGGIKNNTYLRTDLTFGLTSTTQTRQIALDFGGAIDIGDEFSNKDVEFKNPFIGLTYDAQAPNSDFLFDISYDRTRVRDLGVDEDFNQNDLVLDLGDRDAYRLGFDWASRGEQPITFGISGNYRRLVYTGTTDPDLDDEERYDISGDIGFRLSPTLELGAFASYEEYEIEDDLQTQQETSIFGLSMTYEVNPRVVVDGRISYDEISRDERFPASRVLTENDGFSGDIEVRFQRPSGDWNVRADSELLLEDRRNSLSIGKAVLLPRGSLEFEIGASQSEETPVRPLADIDYLLETSRSRFTVGLTQDFSVADDNEESQRTLFEIGYISEINSVSSWEASGSYARFEELTGDGDVGERSNLSLSYRYRLTRNWDLRSGIERDEYRSTDEEDERIDSIFIEFTRAFSAER